MAVLSLVLLLGLPVFLLGVFIWAVLKHFLTAEVPSTMPYPVKLRFLHCLILYVIALGNTLEKLRICSMPRFVRFLQDSMTIIEKDPRVVVTNLRFGTIPVRLFQPKAASSSPRRDSYHSLCNHLARETDSVVLSVGYRKAPDYHYPTIYQDCLNATIHFLKDSRTYGVEPSQVIICGESMGASTVAMVTQTLVGRTDLPQTRAQILIYPAVQLLNLQLPSFRQKRNVPLLTHELYMTFLCDYLSIDYSWKNAIWSGAGIPPENWKKYKKWLSSDNIPNRFKNKDQEPQFPGPFNESAYLETKTRFDVRNSLLMADDEIIRQLPETFLVSCEHDILRDDALLYKKRLEDQGVPVNWYHVEDGFHGCVPLFDKKFFSFPCSQNIVNSVVSYI
uniref:Alpha/beta hydrolase fold-3 domain-containing protein n=1 Tax=Cavia porcellus TaxID=10141 RepID=H0VGF3_CAVPO